MCERLMAEGLGEADFRYASSRFEATGDPDLRVLAQHMRAFEMFAAEEAERELTSAMATESSRAMQEFLREAGVPMKQDQGRRWPADHAGKVHEPQAGPQTTAALNFPTQTTAEPMSWRLRAMAGQIRRLAGLAGTVRQRNRLLLRAREIEKMSVRQYEREGAAGDPDQFQDFDSWSDKPSAADQVADDVQDQRDGAMDEDLPRVPAPGRRYAEDQFGDKSNVADQPLGFRRNRSDDDIMERLRRGTAKPGSGVPRMGDRYGGERKRYSAFESARGSRGGDLTAELLLDQAANYLGSHSSF